MKNLFLLVAVFTFQLGISQTSTPADKPQTENNITETPKPGNGLEAFYKYLTDRIRVPEYDNFPGGKMLVTFVVEVDGSLNEIKVLKDLGFGTAEQITKILKKSPKWKPAESNGVPVRSQFSLPITIPRGHSDY